MKKNVLFVCVENSCRSQMAEAFAKKHGKDIINAYSAGSKPSGIVNPSAIEVLKEKGIDISGAKSNGFKEVENIKFDYVITMGCGDVCPFVPAKDNLSWQVTDPKGRDMDFFRKTSDEIETRIKEFIAGL